MYNRLRKVGLGDVVMLSLPLFTQKEPFVSPVNRNAQIAKLTEVSVDSFDFYLNFFKGQGYEQKQSHDNGVYRFAGLTANDEGVFINYFYRTRALHIVAEQNCNYFSFKDACGEKICEPQITQLSLVDYGMSYVIRLSDGRFILIDGGNNYERDVDRLMAFLKESSPLHKPVIACWIMTHAHSDHFHAYFGMEDKYEGEYEIQSFMLNFMEVDDERFPGMEKASNAFGYDNSNLVNIPILFDRMKKTGAPIYMAHTGQIYNFGDAKIELLSTLDEMIDFMRANINATSLVFKMELGGQTILWTGDATLSEASLPQRYGDYIKSDIFQVPHHGFEGPIDPKVELEGYIINSAKVCFLPVSKNNAYTAIDTFHVGPRYLFQYADAEVIVGDDNKTITLPYTPSPHRILENRYNFREGLSKSGATVWTFTGLKYENADDVEFEVLKSAGWVDATITAQLYFFDKAKNISNIRFSLKTGYHRINIADFSKNVINGVWHSGRTLAEKGFESEGEFAIKFISSMPVVISNKNHQAAYKNELNV